MTKLVLRPDDREWVEKIVIPLLSADKSTTASQVYGRVHKAAAAGQRRAMRVETAMALAGAMDLVTDLSKRDHGTIYIKAMDATVTVPTRYGVHGRDADGLKDRAWQQPLWWEMSRAQFEEMITALRRQSDLLARNADAFNEVLRVWDDVPDAKTAGEVCTRLGIDPRKFEAS